MPTDEEDARITAAALADPDNPPADKDWFKRARPAIEVHPDLVADYIRRRGRPPKARPKIAVKLRLDAEVIDALKQGGPDWQTRANAVLARWAKRRG
ncbi:MAG: BrnA antitoxin family protein [Rhodospirillales bacterium]